MDMYIEQLQAKYNELIEQGNKLQEEIVNKTAEFEAIRNQLAGLEMAAGLYNSTKTDAELLEQPMVEDSLD